MRVAYRAPPDPGARSLVRQLLRAFARKASPRTRRESLSPFDHGITLAMGLLLAFLLLSAGLSYRNNARPRRFRGRAELALTELGTEQARATGRRIVETWKPVAVYTSPLGRCVVTGQIIATILGITAAPLAGLNHLRSLASSPPRFATLAEVDI